MSPREAHELLDLATPHTREELEAAYHRCLNLWHPAHFAEDETLLAEAMGQTIRVNEAYQLLLHPPDPAAMPALDSGQRLRLPQPIALPEPKVESPLPRIVGPRLRLPRPDPTQAVPGTLAPPRLVVPASPARSPSKSSPVALPGSGGPAPLIRLPPRPTPPRRSSLVGRAAGLLVLTALVWLGAASFFNRSGSGGPSLGLASALTPNAPVSLPAALTALHERAENDQDAIAQRQLGDAFKNGIDVVSNLTEAFHWYQQAALQGDAPAQRELGHAYRDGRGVSPDLPQAARWYRRAASQGDEEAADSLRLIQPGSSVP